MNMDLDTTQRFADEWNRANDLPVGEDTTEENMRVVEPGIVTWNAYDAPDVDVEQFVALAQQATNEGV